MIGVGVIGLGYWGPNLVRNFSSHPRSQVLAAADLSEERRAGIKTHYPTISMTADADDVINDPRVDAVVIATPVHTHYELALKALQAGKHVWVEKPLASTSEQALELAELAESSKLSLFVDHTFVYTPAVRKIKGLIDSGKIGVLQYYDSVRINLGLFQSDVNVLWDLAVHDLAIMDYIIRRQPLAVSATGTAHVPGKPANMAYMTVYFKDSLLAHIHANWLAPVKIRRTLIGGDKQMIVYDDLEPSEKIKVYDKGISVESGGPARARELLIGYRAGDMWAPQLPGGEALQAGAEEFISAIEAGRQPLTDGRAGHRVVLLLEKADFSLKNCGEPVDLNG